MAIQKFLDSHTPSLSTLVRVHERIQKIPAFLLGTAGVVTGISIASAIVPPELKVELLGASATLGTTLGLLAFKMKGVLQKAIFGKVKKEQVTLHDAIWRGDLDLAKLWIREVGVDLRNKRRGETALQIAVMKNNASAVQFLLDRGADPNARDWQKRTSLHYVKSAKIAKLLLDRGANPNAQDICRETPLHTARKAGIAALLLEAGADLNIRSAGLTPLHTARTAGVAQQLLQAGANPHDRENGWQWTPLHTARKAGIAALLLEAGVDPHAKDRSGSTPLHTAREKGVARELLQAGVSPHERNQTGSTPLHSAQNEEVAKLLIGAGARVDAESRGRMIPLHLAVLQNNAKMVKVLLDAGSEIYARERSGLTPMQLLSPDSPLIPIFINHANMLHQRICEHTLPIPEEVCRVIDSYALGPEGTALLVRQA